VTHTAWINAQDLLRERAALRTEVAHLRAENERLRGALVNEVFAEMRDVSKHASAESCASSKAQPGQPKAA
jgi:regulator of replication initiation timing